MILISDLLTVLSSINGFNFISLAVILSRTHPNPNLSKNMIVSLLIVQSASVSNLDSFQYLIKPDYIFIIFKFLFTSPYLSLLQPML